MRRRLSGKLFFTSLAFSVTANAVTTVPGTANITLAGQPSGVSVCGGTTAPIYSPAIVTDVPIIAGQALVFSVLGTVSVLGTPSVGPDGTSQYTPQNTGGLFGIGAINAPLGSLIGVFAANGINSNLLPPRVFAAFGGTQDLTVVRPLLQQPFLVGSGFTSDGTSRVFIVPDGATRLFLGVASQCSDANTGSFVVRTSAIPQPEIPLNPLAVPAISNLGLVLRPVGSEWCEGTFAPNSSPPQVALP